MTSLFNAVNGAELDRFLRGITHVVRLSGTPEEAEAFDFIEKELKGFGYEVNRYASDALIGYPLPRRSRLLGEARRSPRTATRSARVPALDGFDRRAVYVGEGATEDYDGQDVRGKIVLSDGLANPAKGIAATAGGDAGQININDEYIHEMIISPVWGTPTPQTAPLLPEPRHHLGQRRRWRGTCAASPQQAICASASRPRSIPAGARSRS